MINKKKIRKIRGKKKERIRQYLTQYILSFPFVYSLIFATLHFFFDKDKNGLFLITYGLIMIDIFSNVLYLKLSISQLERDLINDHLKSKKQFLDLKPLLLDKGSERLYIVISFKLLLFLAISAIYILYLYGMKYLFGIDAFMTNKSAFEYTMFFCSIVSFEVFWIGGVKNISYNLINLKAITKDDSLGKKIIFYSLLIFVILYKMFSKISDFFYGISFLPF